MLIYILLLIFPLSILAFQPTDLVGCYQTIEVNDLKVNLKENKSLITNSYSSLYKDKNNLKLKAVVFNLFNKRHFENTNYWDEWNNIDLYLNYGSWQNVSDNSATYTFKGYLNSYYNPSIIFDYRSNILIQKNEKLLSIQMSYSYNSNSGFNDSWSQKFLLKRISDNQCLLL